MLVHILSSQLHAHDLSSSRANDSSLNRPYNQSLDNEENKKHLNIENSLSPQELQELEMENEHLFETMSLQTEELKQVLLL